MPEKRIPRLYGLPALILFTIVFLLPLPLLAQSSGISGLVVDENGSPLSYATVTLLHPSDSTLAFWGITNEEGHFDIPKTLPGPWLMQVAFLGMQTCYRDIRLPLSNGNTLQPVVMKPVPLNLTEVNIQAEHIPFLIKQDTIEYNAAAFRTRPDAVAEDLIRKLPGIEVDRVGNIKALGEDVNNVLVDGKEFFSNDPKVATKNLPAGAIKKVQVYDKKSDQSELTGISDGERNKTVNLVLKDDQKKMWFGDLRAGGGTDAHFQANAKAYRFTDKNQFAVLAMGNNINQFGFSFQDYMDFNGGIGSMMSGGNQARITISSDDNLPVNFGQPVSGLVTSGAGGINYTYEPKKDNRFNISYLGNVVGKKLDESVHTENFTSGSSFLQDESDHTTSEEWNHGLNLGWKNKRDSLQTIRLSGRAGLIHGNSDAVSETSTSRADTLFNLLNAMSHNNSNRVAGNFGVSWLRKGTGRWKLFKVSADAAYTSSLSRSQWENITRYIGITDPITDKQFLRNHSAQLTYAVNSAVMRQIGKTLYLEPALEAGGSHDRIDRIQGTPGGTEQIIDSLSPCFTANYVQIRPELTLKHLTKKNQFYLTAAAEFGRLFNFLNDSTAYSMPVCYFIPRASWEYEYATGNRITLYYAASVGPPAASQLLPTVNNRNPLYLFSGNRYLKPEYRHDLFAQWFLYDAFSFTSFFVNLTGGYIHDKISYARTVNDSLGQVTTLINVPDDYAISLRADFSRPIRKLGINLHLGIRESWNQSMTMIDGKRNSNTNWNHSIRFSIDNRKKEKWDVSAGVEFDLTNARYSIQESMNTDYFDLVYFGEIRYTPTDRWNFMVGADVTNYNAESFNDAVSVPLLKAEISYSFLKNNRMMLSIEGYDLLNRNTGIQRVSEQNYLRETRTNIIGRYVMLSLKYRLNRSGDGGSGWSIRTS